MVGWAPGFTGLFLLERPAGPSCWQGLMLGCSGAVVPIRISVYRTHDMIYAIPAVVDSSYFMLKYFSI